VKGVMTHNITFARSATTVDELRRIMVEGNVGRVPVVTDLAYEDAVAEKSARVGDVIGIATRTDVLAAYQGRWEQEQAETAEPRYMLRRPSLIIPPSVASFAPAPPFPRTSPVSTWWVVSSAT